MVGKTVSVPMLGTLGRSQGKHRDRNYFSRRSKKKVDMRLFLMQDKFIINADCRHFKLIYSLKAPNKSSLIERSHQLENGSLANL
jgi:hypothetical protein